MTIEPRAHNTPEAVFLLGIPCSGKTVFYRERFLETHVRIALSMLRTRQREDALLHACLEARQSFALDRIHPSRVERRIHLTRARHHGFHPIAYVFETPLREALRENASRPAVQRLADTDIIEAHNGFEPPLANEGFARLVGVRRHGDGSFTCRELSLTAP